MIDEPHSEITRREFLAVGSATFLSSLTVGNRAWGNPAFIPSDNSYFTSIGFVPFDKAEANTGRLLKRIVDLPFTANSPEFEENRVSASPIARMEDARSRAEGSAEFVEKGLRLTVWGAVPRSLQDTPDAIDVEVFYEPYHSNRFRAWSFRKSPAWTEQSPSRLCVPTDANLGLNLNVSMRWGHTTKADGTATADRERSGRIHLALAPEADTPKLLRGVYVIPLSDRGPNELNRLSEGRPLYESESPLLLLETEYGDRHINTIA